MAWSLRQTAVASGCTLAFIGALTARAAAQPSPRFEVTGSLGAVTVYEDEGSLGSGFSGGAGFDWLVTDGLSIGIELTGASHERDVTGFKWEGRPVVVLGRVTKMFGSRVAQPFVTGGAGMMHASGTTIVRVTTGTEFPPVLVSEPPHEWSATGFAWMAGGGVHVALRNGLVIRPEFTLTVGQVERPNVPFSPEPPFWLFRPSVAVGYRW